MVKGMNRGLEMVVKDDCEMPSTAVFPGHEVTRGEAVDQTVEGLACPFRSSAGILRPGFSQAGVLGG